MSGGVSQLAAEIGEVVAARMLAVIEPQLAQMRAAFEQRLVGIDALAELLGISESAARQRVRRDQALRKLAVAGGAGAHWKWRRSDLIAAMRATGGVK